MFLTVGQICASWTEDSLLLRRIQFAFGLRFLVESDLVGKHVVQVVIKELAPFAPLDLELGQGNCSFEVSVDSHSSSFSSLADDAFFESVLDTETSEDFVKFARPVDLFKLVNLLSSPQNETLVHNSLF